MKYQINFMRKCVTNYNCWNMVSNYTLAYAHYAIYWAENVNISLARVVCIYSNNNEVEKN